MRRLRSFSAWMLLALWLPATLHCSLEQAGWLECGTACADNCASACAADNCDLLESGLFKSTTAAVKVSAPSALTCLCCLTEISPATIIVPILSPERSGSPPELVRTWQFAARAAPLPGAPSPLS